jgi:hypothetical protein
MSGKRSTNRDLCTRQYNAYCYGFWGLCSARHRPCKITVKVSLSLYSTSLSPFFESGQWACFLHWQEPFTTAVSPHAPKASGKHDALFGGEPWCRSLSSCPHYPLTHASQKAEFFAPGYWPHGSLTNPTTKWTHLSCGSLGYKCHVQSYRGPEMSFEPWSCPWITQVMALQPSFSPSHHIHFLLGNAWPHPTICLCYTFIIRPK